MQFRGPHLFVLAVLVAFALVSSATAHADVPAPGDFSASIWSDKADYSPGEHVVLSGANWQPGESVHVTVNDDAGSTWSRAADVTADAAGTIADEFDLPSWFVAQYSIRAVGLSGAVATSEFTDSNVKFDVTPTNTTTSVTETVFESTSCTGTVKSGPTTLSPTTGDTVGGVSAAESVRLEATPINVQGGTFKNWTGDITTTTSATICVPGSSGNVNLHANYNTASANHAPSGTDKTVTTNEDTTYTFTTADFGFSDTGDTPPNNLAAVKISTLPAVGTLKNNGVAITLPTEISAADITAGKLTFSPAANAGGNPYATFTFQVRDDGGTANGGADTDQSANTITVNVSAVNDAPAGTSNTVSTDEDTDYTFTASDFGFSDPTDSGANALLAVKITTLPTAGTLRDNDSPVTAGQLVAVADISTGKLKFTPAANANGSPYATFTFQVQDDGGTANGGVDLDPSANTITVNVSAVNDAPAGADALLTTLEDTPYTLSASDFGFSDPVDSGANALAAVKITTLPTAGTLSDNAGVVVAGQLISVADISTGKLKFEPAANANGNDYATFDFKVRDDGGTDHGGIDTDPTANTITIDVTPVNDAPAGTDNTVTTSEDTGYAFDTTDFGFSDPSDTPADQFAWVKVTSLPADGSLESNGAALALNAEVSAADIMDGKLKFVPDADQNGEGYATFEFQVRDAGGIEHGGVDLDQSANTLTIDVTPVNDRPTADATDALTIDEDSGAHDVTLSGVDKETSAGDLTFTITHAPAHGTLRHGTTTLADDDTFSGSPQDVSYTPAANFNGNDGFKFTVTDRGDPDDCGTPGAFCTDKAASDEQTVDITVDSVNDAPAGADKTVTTNEDHAYTLTGADFGFSDPSDTPADQLAAVTIATLPGDGTLTEDGNAVTAGQEIAVADLVAGKLKFTPDANENGTGYAHFGFQVRDNGGTAHGGVDTDTTANTITIDVTSVNDAPDGADKTVTTDEDTPYALTTADFGLTDLNDTPADQLASVKIAALPAHGTLRDDGVAVTLPAEISAADITAGNLTFAPDANDNGDNYAHFDFQVRDNGGTANSGVDLDPDANTITIDVTPVNDAPVLSSSGTPSLSDIVAEDPGNGGTSIEALIANGGPGYITDVDSGALAGIAITDAATADGAWEYSTNDGADWHPLDAVSDTNARLLAATSSTKLRFVSNTGFAGTVSSGITFRAWDRTSGANGELVTTSPHGDATAFSDDTDSASIVVQQRATTVDVSCTPASVVAAQSTTCTATVTDAETHGNKHAPAGSVSAAAIAGSGNVGSTPCTLAGASASTSSCTFTYTPDNAQTATHVVKGSYAGSAIYKSSEGTASVAVAKRATQTTVTCGNPVALGGGTITCTAAVADIDGAGTKSSPGGVATFAETSAAGGFTTGSTCTLQPISGTKSSSCGVTYKSTTVGVDSITAAYGGSDVHAISDVGTAGGLAVTYDPNAGFVTGGGTIASPVGAYAADVNLAGQASFGFVSKYQKGQSTPTGQTEFQFQTAKFNFHSELYDWLVVSGTKAQYKGTGTVNGATGYSFMITAADGSPDRFRMKIWNTQTSAVVYDNKPGGADALADSPTQDISGGSIVIHK